MQNKIGPLKNQQNVVQSQPFLRWAGSKRQLLPLLGSFWQPSFERYIEPFMGSACLFFSIGPKVAILNDLNKDLVQTFRVVRDAPGAVAKVLAAMPTDKDAYYATRARDPSALSDVNAAARFIFLNRFCFNGLHRTNLQGQFNVPYGPNRNGKLPTASQLAVASQALRGVTLKSGDFQDALALARRGDFVYLDPPFAVANRRMFKQYGPQFFGIEDLERMATSLVSLNDRGVSFVLSYAYCSEALRIWRRWRRRKVMVHRNIAGFARCRRTAAELIVSNCI